MPVVAKKILIQFQTMPDVYANSTLIGTLDRQPDCTRFIYAQSVGSGHSIALTMPACPNVEFDAPPPRPLVHPVFAMNLPEGALREEIVRMFAQTLPCDDDLALLEITGRSQIGRLRIVASPSDLDSVRVPATSLDNILKAKGADSGRIFHDLLQHHAHYSGISGVQPKLLVRDNGSLAPAGRPIIVPGTTHIIKFFEADKFPALAANEYLCLQAAKAAGIPVPEVLLSENQQCLVIKRFDANPDGSYLAVEDACSLENLQPDYKYIGTYEQVAKTLALTIAPGHLAEDMRAFFRTLVLSVIVRNGDAHRKNFSVVYNTRNDVRFSPAYDIISTTPYIPKDTIALMLNGSKRWPGRKSLVRFGINSCKLTQREATEAIEQTREAVTRTRELLIAMRKDAGSTRAGHALASMLAAWEDGLWQTREPSDG